MLDRDGIQWALGFYSSLPQAVPRNSQIAEGAKARIVPLFAPPVRSATVFLEGFPTEPSRQALFRSYLRPEGSFVGVGEVTLYDAATISLTFQSPDIAGILAAVSDAGGIAMLHPRSRPPNPTTLQEIEMALSSYPAMKLVLHGTERQSVMDLGNQGMSRNPNVYVSHEPGWISGLFTARSADEFLQKLAAAGVDSVLKTELDALLPRIRTHPSQVMWGTDRFEVWHYDAAMDAELIRTGRLLIGMLPPELQEPYAYKNALRLLGPYLVPSVIQ